MKQNRFNLPARGMLLRLPPRHAHVRASAHAHAGGEHYDYFGFADGAIISQGRASLAELPVAQTLILVLAAEDVLLTEAVVPPVAASRLRVALPNLIEDRALTDVAGLHVAQVQADQAGPQTLAVVDRAWLKSVIARFESAGHRIAAVWPESLCVQQQGSVWSLAAVATAADDGARLWLRIGSSQAFALPGDVTSAVLMLKALIEQAGQPPQLTLHASREQMPVLQQMAAAVACETQGIEGDPLRRWFEAQATGATSTTPPRSLLQHELAPSAFGATRWASWHRVAMLFIALLVVQIIATQIHWAQLRSERSALREQAATLLRSAFPETTTILDAPLQMERALAALRGQAGQSDPNDFTALVSAAGSIFSAAPVNAFQALEFGTDTNPRSLRIHLAPGVAANTEEQNSLNQRANAAGYELRFEPASAAINAAGKSTGAVALLRARGAT